MCNPIHPSQLEITQEEYDKLGLRMLILRFNVKQSSAFGLNM